MSAVGLVARQVRYTNRAFWRNPAAAVFTFAFPLMFLVVLSLVFGGGEMEVEPGRTVSTAVFYIPRIAVFAVVSACYTSVAMMVTIQRERGVLKRVRGTPLPSWAYLAGRVGHAVLVAALLVVVCVAYGAVVHGAPVPTATLPAFLVSLALGAATSAALGLTVTAAIPTAEAASPIVNATILPLLFVSDVFIPLEDPPAWLDLLGKAFPVRHFAEALEAGYFGLGSGGFRWGALAILAAWALAGSALARRSFRWEPRT